MSSSNAVFVRSTLFMLGLGVLLLAGIVGTSLWLTSANRIYSDTVAEMRRIRTGSVDLLTALQDAETGQRGFLLTNDESYLAPYFQAVKNLPERRKRLADVLQNYPDYAERLPVLDQAVDGKMAEIDNTVALAKAGRMQEALAIVRNDSGKALMDDARGVLVGFISQTDDRLRVIVGEQLKAASNLQWVTIGGALAIAIVVGGAILIIVQHVRDLSRAREELQSLNFGLEERVNERTEDLMQANQEIQRFAYIVTHDLRAPLVNIMGFLSELEASLTAVTAYVMADEKKPSEDEIKEARLAVEEDLPEAMGFIRSSTRKMDSLINAILKISRDGRRKLVPERIDLKAMLETAAANVHHQVAEADGEVEMDIRVPGLITDRFSLDQIFGNLFDNAVKYRYLGRPVRIAVRAMPAGKGRIRIDVEDNGRGIAVADRERVFELFRRAGEQDQPGEGIGLAYVRSLIRNLGGDITVASTEGTGSTFTLLLPSDLTTIVKGTES
ncbi:CHASE3 domain-containing protein [Rhizobium sp. OAE497]|uniref:sensor histidine kinase n=1 Tax=Rhizobium sp. OAE497 TaxID=2663796 RepID=UPI001A22A8D2